MFAKGFDRSAMESMWFAGPTLSTLLYSSFLGLTWTARAEEEFRTSAVLPNKRPLSVVVEVVEVMVETVEVVVAGVEIEVLVVAVVVVAVLVVAVVEVARFCRLLVFLRVYIFGFFFNLKKLNLKKNLKT